MSTLYSSRPNLVLGFHGCDRSIANTVINNGTPMKPSQNDYDWLGNGIYFWENNAERAFDWAVEQSKRPNSKIKIPAVIGAVLDLGYCFDLLDTHYLEELKTAYDAFVKISQEANVTNSEKRVHSQLYRFAITEVGLRGCNDCTPIEYGSKW